MYYEVKSKISSTRVQHTVIFFIKNNTNNNEIWRTWTKEKKKPNNLSKFYWLSSSAPVNWYIFTYFSAFSVSNLFLMLEHTKPYVENMHYIDAELAGHVGYMNLMSNGRVCVRVGFSLFSLCVLAQPYQFGVEWIDQQHFAKTKMGYISLPSNLNAIIYITSHYCVILKMVILHGPIKTIQQGFLCLFLKKIKNVFFQNPKKKDLKNKTPMWIAFFRPFFFQPWSSSVLFCDFPLVTRSGTSHVTISLIGCASHT